MRAALALLLVLSPAASARPAEADPTPGRRITIAGGRLALTEPDHSRVVLYDVSGERPRKLGAFGAAGGLGGEMRGPQAATLDPARGWVYVADTGNHRVQVFDVAGLEAGRLPRLVRLFGAFGRGVGELSAPQAAVLRPAPTRLEGPVFVVDGGNDRVQVFDARGRATGTILDGKGGAPGQMDGPVAAAFDPRGRVLYVAESVSRRISAFDAVTGVFLFAFAQEVTPGGVAVDGAGVVHLTDVAARLVRRYAPRRGAGGRVRGVVAAGAWGSDDPAWRQPQSIAVDARGRVYVVDGADGGGRIFSATGRPLGVFGEDAGPGPLVPGGGSGPSLPAAICANGGTFQVEVLEAPSPIPLGALVGLEVRVRDGCRGGRPADGITLRVDAVMPGHGHGMNTQPRATPLGEGRFGVSGLRFHMPGQWIVHFDAIRGATLERAQATVEIE
jgi:sugar lactone lactonase YvrE